MKTAFLIVLLLFIAAATTQAADRDIRVVTVGEEGLKGPSFGPETFARLDETASFKPDIACLPEAFTRGEPETLDGPTVGRARQWAREHACYVICPIHRRAEGRVFNTAVLIDRRGNIVGGYDKIHPTETEIKQGISPGPTNPPVFQTDFGRIGIQTCFDVNWHEGFAQLKQKGAQVIFWPSAYAAPQQMSGLALLNQTFIVVSPGRSPPRIYDITGYPLDVGRKGRWWAEAVLPLGERLFETDTPVPALMRQVEKKYGPKVRTHWMPEDGWITLASASPDLTVGGIVKEFGLPPLTDYIVRSQQEQDQARPQ